MFDRLGTTGTICLICIGLVLRTMVREVQFAFTLWHLLLFLLLSFYNSNFCSLISFHWQRFWLFFLPYSIILFYKQYLGDSVGPFLIFGLAGVVFYMRYQQRGKQSELLARAAQLRGSQQNLLNSKNLRLINY